MKKFLYLSLLLLLVAACARHENKAASMEVEMDEAEETTGLSGFIWDEVSGNSDLSAPAINSSEGLAVEKLRELFELYELKQTHPQFEGDIQSQLKRLTENAELFAEKGSLGLITNIRKKGNLIRITDTTERLDFYFKRTVGGVQQTDSLSAIITTAKIYLNGEEMSSIKVTFRSIE